MVEITGFSPFRKDEEELEIDKCGKRQYHNYAAPDLELSHMRWFYAKKGVQHMMIGRLSLYWVGESNSYCKIENLEY